MKKREGSILLIDSDGGECRESLASSLDGFEIIFMPDRKKACDFFFHSNVDLVLLDHDRDGFCTELLGFFKSLKPLVPVIIMTGNGSEAFAVEVFRLGADDYFKKPLLADEFQAGVKNILGIRNEKNNAPHIGLERAVDCIHSHYNTRLSLSQIAGKAGMSISCFERKFKKEMGLTFNVYLNKLRINKAMELLNEKGLSISDIAFACGFTNQFHFTRTFKKFMEVPPVVYRKTLRG